MFSAYHKDFIALFYRVFLDARLILYFTASHYLRFSNFYNLFTIKAVSLQFKYDTF